MLLQNPVEAKGALTTGYKSARPSQIVLPDGLSPGALGVTFHAHPSQGMLECHQSILPRGDGSFSAFQFPLPGKELFLYLDGHHRCCHHA
jgi:hypothetical protein